MAFQEPIQTKQGVNDWKDTINIIENKYLRKIEKEKNPMEDGSATSSKSLRTRLLRLVINELIF